MQRKKEKKKSKRDENFFLKIFHVNDFSKKNFSISNKENFNSTKINVIHSENIPENFFCYYFYPLFFEKYNENLITNLISKNNLWYLQKKLFLSNFRHEKSSFLDNSNKFYFKGTEPKTKNICMIEIDKKQTSIETVLNYVKFKSGKNFKKDLKFLKNLKKSKTLSNIDISMKKVKNDESCEFFDVFLDFKEKKNLHLKPEINFDGFDFSTSIVFLNKILLGKWVESKTKIEFIKEISRKRKFFFSLKSSLNNRNFIGQKFFFNLEKTKENKSSFNFGLFSKKKNIAQEHDIRIVSKKNWEDVSIIDSFQLSSQNNYNIYPDDQISFKSQIKANCNHLSKKNLKFSLLIKNSLKGILGGKLGQNLTIRNELFRGNPSFVTDYFSDNSLGKNFKKNREKVQEGRQKFSKRSSFHIGKKFQEVNTSVFFFSESFSHKNNSKQFSNLFFGIGMKIQNLFAFHFWLDKTGNKGFYIGI